MPYLSMLFTLMFEVLFQLFDFLQIRSIRCLGFRNTPLLIEDLITLTSNLFHVLAAG